MESSKIPWLSHRPHDWKAIRLKNLFYEHKIKNNGLVETNLLSLSYGNIVRRDINQRGGLLPESFESYNVVEANDIALRLTDLQNDQKSLRTGLIRERGIITSAYLTLRARKPLCAPYFELLLKAYDFRKMFYSLGGGVRQSLSFDDISVIPVLEPSPEEQCRIVQYVNNKTAEIDRVVEKLQREVELLERYRRELIAQTVTRGLDPHAQMRDSGIEWTPDIPAVWRTLPFIALLKHEKILNSELKSKKALQFKNGAIVPKSEWDSEDAGLIDVIKTYKLVQPGMIVINGLNLNYDFKTKRVGLVTESGAITSAYITLSVSKYVNVRFLSYLLKSMDSKLLFHGMTEGVRKILSWKDIRRELLPIPPLEEQISIANFLDNKVLEIDSAVEGIKRQIELLGKYRKQVINDAVTGKVRVGEVA